MNSIKPIYRSFLSWSTEEVEKRAYKAAKKGDLETLSYCLAVLSPKHRNIELTAWLNITEFAQKRGLQPIDWLERAAETTSLFTRQTCN